MGGRSIFGLLVLTLIGVNSVFVTLSNLESHPVIACDEPEWDFGSVDSLSSPSHVFVIRNDGRKELVVTMISAACHCIKLSPSKFPQSLPPGATLDCAVRLDLSKLKGTVRRKITVYSNDADRSEYELTMTGSVSKTSEGQNAPDGQGTLDQKSR